MDINDIPTVKSILTNEPIKNSFDNEGIITVDEICRTMNVRQFISNKQKYFFPTQNINDEIKTSV